MNLLVGLLIALSSLLPPQPRALLHDWDARRSAAWVAEDTRALRELYVPGSRAGEYDVALLREWQQRALHVQRMETQVLSLAVLRRSHDRLVLRVTDRVGLLEVSPPVRLPRDRARTRVIELRLFQGSWRVAAVRPD